MTAPAAGGSALDATVIIVPGPPAEPEPDAEEADHGVERQ